MKKSFVILILGAILLGFVSCQKDPTSSQQGGNNDPTDKYLGSNVYISLADGCETLDVEDIVLYIKAPDGSIILRRASHERIDSVSEFTLEHGLVEGVYHLLYAEYETVDEEGKSITDEHALGCRIAFEGGRMNLRSRYNDTFDMYSSGTEIDTLYVVSADNIINIIQMSNDQRTNGEFKDDTYFLQMRNFDGDNLSKDVSRSYGWLPIGWQSSLPFRGTYDGGGHSIDGLWVDREYMAPVGFIGFSEGARVCNLTIKDARLKGDMAVAGIVGVACSSEGKRKLTYIDNCKVENSAIVGAEESYGVGGILGIVDYQSRAHVHRCHSMGNTISAHSQAGGVVGAGVRTSSLITYLCENDSEVSSEYNSAGGIVGMCDTLLAAACVNRHAIVGAHKFVSPNKELGQGNVGCGGIAGGTGSSFFVACKNEGEIVGRSGVGGIVGSARFIGGDPDDEGYMYNNVAMYYCANAADVTGDEFVGGLCGEAQYGIFGGHNTGNITAHENYAGGIVGNGALAAVHNCVNEGYIYADAYAGGVVGMTSTCSLALCQNYGGVEAATSHGAGIVGIMGDRGTVTYCANYGDIYHSAAMGDATRAITASEYFAGIAGQAGDPAEWGAAEIASIVYAAVEMAVGIAGVPFAALSVATIPGKAIWSGISTAATVFAVLTVFADGGVLIAGIVEKVDNEEARKEMEDSYTVVEEECDKIEMAMSNIRSSYLAAVPGDFSALAHNEAYQLKVAELVDYLTVSSENLDDYNKAINQSQYDRMKTLNDQALAKDITHSIISGLCIIVSAVGAVVSIVATGGAAAPVIAGAVIGGIGAVAGGANSIWETCTTYVTNVDESSQNSNYGAVHAIEGSTKVGGIFGVAEENVIIRDCFNAGYGTAGGHLVGEMYHEAELVRSLSIADENAWGGKIYSSKDSNASLSDLFYYSASEAKSMSGATGLSLTELYDTSKYTNWDFDPETGLWSMPDKSSGNFPVISKSRFAVQSNE